MDQTLEITSRVEGRDLDDMENETPRSRDVGSGEMFATGTLFYHTQDGTKEPIPVMLARPGDTGGVAGAEPGALPVRDGDV